MNLPATPYWHHITPAVHRLLGELDRSPGSFLEGSFHRESWLYRFGGDFHPATRQCAVYPLARLWVEPGRGNPYYRNDEILRYLRGALTFTASRQNADGSFPEWYPGQPSFCATAYLSAYLSEILLLPGDPPGSIVRQEILRALDRSAGWMAGKTGSHPGNQSSAALLAFHNCATLLGSRWNPARDRSMERFLSSRSREGWTSEYGGPDPGYESLTVDFLTRCFDRGLDGVKAAIRSGLGFIDAAVLPDGVCPSSLSWRGTNFVVPYAAERWSGEEPAARRLARRIRLAVSEGRIPTPSTTDGRYAAHFFLPSYVDAHFRCSGAVEDPAEDIPPSAHPEEGGIRVVRGETFVVHLQGRKGGVAIYSNGLRRTIWIGHTYCLRSSRDIFVPDWSGKELHPGEEGMEWNATFHTLPQGRRLARVASACAAAGRYIGAGDRIEALIKTYAFGPGSPGPARLLRSVEIQPDHVRIRDTLCASRTARGTELHPVPGGGASNQPSSGMFSGLELSMPPALSGETAKAIADVWRSGGSVNVELVFAADGGETTYRCRVEDRDTAGGKIDAGRLR